MKTSDITDAQVVHACAQAQRCGFERSTLQHLIDATSAPPKIALRAIGRASGRGYCDWGVSDAYAWPTPDGLRLLTPAPT